MSVTVGTDAAGVAAAARAVRAGGVILYPTETVYGLGGDAGRDDVVARVRAMKGRDAEKPVLIITDELGRVASWLAEPGAGVTGVLAHEPPLAVTLLIPATPAAPAGIIGPDGLIGVRRTSDSFCLALIAEADAPLISTSANPAGEPATALFDDVAGSIKAGVDVAVDAGRPLPGTPSTVARIADGQVEIVRAGAVDRATLERLVASAR